MRHILIIFLLAFSLTAYSQSTPPPVSRGSDNTTQVDRFVTALKRLGIPTADADTLSPGLQLTDAENSAKLLFNTTSQKLRLYVPGTGWRDATPIDLTNYYTKSQVDSLLSELPIGASNLSISSRTDTTVIVGNSNGTGVTLPAATDTTAGVMSASDKIKLDGVESGAQVNTVTDVAGKTGSVELDKDDIDGLDQVDNTSDEDKPVSNATLDSLNTRERIANKATGFGTLNNTLYPTTQAVNNQITTRLGSYVPLAGNATMTGLLNWTYGGFTSIVTSSGMQSGGSLTALGNSTNTTITSPGTVRIKEANGVPTITFHNADGSRKALIGTNITGGSNRFVYYLEGNYPHDFATNGNTRLSIADAGVTVTSSIPLINNRAATANGHVVSKGFADTTYVLNSTRGAVNGVATLDGSGKIPLTQIPTSIPYQGTWDASTNTPTLADGAGTAGFYYRVSVSGSQNLGSGTISFSVGDDVIYNGSIWQRAPGGATATNLSLGSVTDTSIVINNSNGTGVTIPAVTESNAGLMTAADKDKIDEAVTEETDPTVDSHIKAITTGDISNWKGKLDSSRRVTSFSSPNNINVPTTQAVVNYVTSASGSYVPLAGNATMTGALNWTYGGFTSIVTSSGIQSGGSITALGNSTNGTTTSGGVIRLKNSSSIPFMSFHNDDGGRKSLIGHTVGSGSNRLLYYIEGDYPHEFSTNGNIRLSIADAGVTVASSIPLINNRAATANGHVVSKGFADTTYVPKTRTITVNGTPYALSSNISFTTPNTTYSAGTGLTLTGTVFTPTFGTTSGTVAQGNHTHDTATVSVSGFMTPYDKARIASFSTAGLATLGTTQTFTAQKSFNGASANLFMDEGSTGVSPFIYFRNTNNSINGDSTSMYYNSGTAGHVMRVNGTARLTITSSGITVNGGISGGGSGITGLNGSNISSGTVPFARLPVGTSGSTVAVGNHTHAFSAITDKPTTLSGYGITDAVSSSATRTANTVFAGPTSGSAAAPTFRALVAADMPSNVLQTDKATQVVTAQLAFNGASANILMNERATGLSPYIYFRNTDNSISGTNTAMLYAAGGTGHAFSVSGTNRLNVTSSGINVNGGVSASSFSGNGSALTTLNADNISAGTVAAARLPIASAGSLGAIRIGSGLSVDGAGVVSVSGSGGTTDLKLRTAGSADTGSVRYAGTTATAGQFYGGVTMPSPGERLNFGGTIVAYNLTAANVVQGNQLLGTNLVSKTISTGTPYNIASGTVIAFVNGSTQYASVSSNTTYGVTLDAGQVMDVEITNTSGSAITITFTGATLPAGQNGQIPAGSSAVFSFKRLNPSNSARVTKVIF